MTDPDIPAPLRGPLLHDFGVFLRLLRSVHDGVALESSMRTAERHLEAEARADLGLVWEHRNAQDLLPPTRAVTRLRERLLPRMHRDDEATRDLLSLDLALEDFLRVSLERSAPLRSDEHAQVQLIPLALRNLVLSWGAHDELQACIAQWTLLTGTQSRDTLWALRTHAAVDRTSRALAACIDQAYELIQPKADYLGRAFHAESWTIQLFGEEVVRGRLEFVVALLLRRLEVALRSRAGIPGCQVVSRGAGSARGRVIVVEDLHAVQGQSFDQPVLVLADRVAGDEELPAGVAAVFSRRSVDLVSHVAVRARNTGLLMMTLHDSAVVDTIRARVGSTVGIRLTPAGDIVQDDSLEADESVAAAAASPRPAPPPVAPFSAFAIGLPSVDRSQGGGKSNQLRTLWHALPSWLQLPPSMVIPFAVFPHVLGTPVNAQLAERYTEQARRIARQPIHELKESARHLRELVLALVPPDGMLDRLQAVASEHELPWRGDERDVWTSIKQVWASKWNERAVLSRRTNKAPDADLHMAVLVQRVAEAEYSFVLHRIHPAAGDPSWGYGEVVPGLGETLVGNHPGRALAFAWHKATGQIALQSMPSKRASLVGGGLMFRSDSNGEDLAHDAGAGLYDSIQLPPPEERVLDYTREPLVWDDAFRGELLSSLAQLGRRIEDALGGAQDIEGTYGKGEYAVVQARPQVGLSR